MGLKYLATGLFAAVYLLVVIHGEDEEPFFLKAEKSIPRIGRASDDKKHRNDDFEKFFLKASKSVPRIGRRNEIQNYGSKARSIPYYMGKLGGSSEDKNVRYPTWSNIADTFEYHPDLLTTPEFLARLEEEMGDDPSVYDWEKVRLKRAASNPKHIVK